MIATVNSEPYPYGTDGLSEAERRAGDCSDYREKERRREADRRMETLDP
jgi:hypothetical protein